MESKRILSKAEFQLLDKMCETIGLSTLLLMENAGKSIANFISQFYGSLKNIIVVIGQGNNGGDGLVAARHLVNYGFDVTCITTAPEEKYKVYNNAVSINYNIAQKLDIPILYWDNMLQSQLQDTFENSNIIVDAIFGVGLNRTLTEKFINIVKFINAFKAGKTIFAVDIPTGLDADTGEIYGEVIQADFTLSFTAYKKCFTIESSKKFCGSIHIFDIGIPQQFVNQLKIDYGLQL